LNRGDDFGLIFWSMNGMRVVLGISEHRFLTAHCFCGIFAGRRLHRYAGGSRLLRSLCSSSSATAILWSGHANMFRWQGAVVRWRTWVGRRFCCPVGSSPNKTKKSWNRRLLWDLLFRNRVTPVSALIDFSIKEALLLKSFNWCIRYLLKTRSWKEYYK
jgi:hypothetical protein